MSHRPFITRIVAVAALAVCSPVADVAAAPRAVQTAARRGGSVLPRHVTGGPSKMIDVALDGDRTLRGRFVDSAGVPIDGAVVTLRQSDRVIARSTTVTNGDFEIHSVTAGVYRLSCGSAARPIRCWTAEAAPPNAVAENLTFQDSVVRGQAGVLIPALTGSSIVTTTAATGAAIGGVAVYASTQAVAKSSAPLTIPTGGAAFAPDAAANRMSSVRNGTDSRETYASLIRQPDGEVDSSKDPATIVLPDDWQPSADDSWMPASP